MIDTGATLAEVDKWYQMRFGKKILKKIPCRPIHMSGFFGHALFGKNGKVRIFWSSDFKRTTVDHIYLSYICRVNSQTGVIEEN